MITEPFYACHVEVGDVVLHKGQTWEVTEIRDGGDDLLYFDVVDAEGLLNGFPYAPFDAMQVVLGYTEE